MSLLLYQFLVEAYKKFKTSIQLPKKPDFNINIGLK